LTMAV